MNQAEMIAEIASIAAKNGAKTDKTLIDAVLKTQAHVVQLQLAEGNEVTLPGLGKLSATKRAARIGRNPKTGEAIEIAARYTPKFSAAKALKDALNG